MNLTIFRNRDVVDIIQKLPMTKKKLSFSICIPVYKGSHLLKNVLKSIFNQTFGDFEIVIGDDNQPDDYAEIEKTKAIIKKFNNKRIRYFKNKINLGYPKNLQKIVSQARNDVIFLMAQDDILAQDALQKTHDAFFLDKDIGAVTRPYFWFEEDIKKPVRAVKPYNEQYDSVLSIYDGQRAITAIFGSVGQLSGLAYIRKYIDVPFCNDVFPAHIAPFAGILKKHKCVFLKDCTVAVSIFSSQTRLMSSIYDVSPTEAWVNMFKTVYKEEKFKKIREICIKHIVTHYTGLVQLKNFGNPGVLEREIKILLKYRWQSIFHLKFWFYVIITLLLPRRFLILLTDKFKRHILSRNIRDLKFSV